jgi:hypothetical protein
MLRSLLDLDQIPGVNNGILYFNRAPGLGRLSINADTV